DDREIPWANYPRNRSCRPEVRRGALGMQSALIRRGGNDYAAPFAARAGERRTMFRQLLTPVADSLPLSFIVAALPVLTVLVLLGVLRRPAWQASLAGLIVGLIIATIVWALPTTLAFNSIANGVVFALWPVMWIVVNALLLYNIA